MSCDQDAFSWPEVMPGAKLPHGFDFTPFIARWREPGQEYSTGAMVRVAGVRGLQYEATTGGQTGDRPVMWPTTIGNTVQDGSVTWTCRAVDATSLLTTVASATWTAPSGATVTGETVYGQVATATIEVDAGVVTGTDLAFTLAASMADSSILPVRVVLPVRVPERQCCA
jgi:hypothetical protein